MRLEDWVGRDVVCGLEMFFERSLKWFKHERDRGGRGGLFGQMRSQCSQ